MAAQYTWTTFPLPNVANFNTVARAVLESWRANSALIDASQVADESDIDDLQLAVGALAAGSGVLVSANDTTVGYLNGKLVAGSGVTLTENTDGGNETLTISAAQAIAEAESMAFFMGIL